MSNKAWSIGATKRFNKGQNWLKDDNFKCGWTVTGDPIRICLYEGCDFAGKNILDHINAFHVKKVLTCNLCGEGFLKSRVLSAHRRVKHKQEAFICKASRCCHHKTAIADYMVEHYHEMHPSFDIPDEVQPFGWKPQQVKKSSTQATKNKMMTMPTLHSDIGNQTVTIKDQALSQDEESIGNIPSHNSDLEEEVVTTDGEAASLHMSVSEEIASDDQQPEAVKDNKVLAEDEADCEKVQSHSQNSDIEEEVVTSNDNVMPLHMSVSEEIASDDQKPEIQEGDKALTEGEESLEKVEGHSQDSNDEEEKCQHQPDILQKIVESCQVTSETSPTKTLDHGLNDFVTKESNNPNKETQDSEDEFPELVQSKKDDDKLKKPNEDKDSRDENLTEHEIGSISKKTFLQKHTNWLHFYNYTIKRQDSGRIISVDCSIPGCSFQGVYMAKLLDHANQAHIMKPLTCNKCGNAYLKMDYLREHLKKLHNQKPYECQVCVPGCQRVFKTPWAELMVDHYKKNHKGTPFPDEIKPFESLQSKFSQSVSQKVCTKSKFESKNLTGRHSEEIANQSTNIPNDLHCIAKQAMESQQFVTLPCFVPKCNFRTQQNEDLEEHLKNQHGAVIKEYGNVNVVTKEYKKKKVPSKNAKEKNKKWNWLQCYDYTVKRIEGQSSNQLTVHCLFAGCSYKGANKNKFLDHANKIHIKKPLMCNKCGKAFLKMEILREHLLKLHHQKAYQCQICSQPNFKTPWAQLMVDHYMTEHKGVPVPYEILMNDSLESNVVQHGLLLAPNSESQSVANDHLIGDECDGEQFNNNEELLSHPDDIQTQMELSNQESEKDIVAKELDTQDMYMESSTGKRVNWLKNNQYKLQKDQDGNKWYICLYDGCSFRSNHRLENILDHINASHVKKILQCNKCGKVTYSMMFLRKHVTKVHKEPAYMCEEDANCQFQSFWADWMVEHYMVKHGCANVPDECKPFKGIQPKGNITLNRDGIELEKHLEVHNESKESQNDKVKRRTKSKYDDNESDEDVPTKKRKVALPPKAIQKPPPTVEQSEQQEPEQESPSELPSDDKDPEWKPEQVKAEKWKNSLCDKFKLTEEKSYVCLYRGCSFRSHRNKSKMMDHIYTDHMEKVIQCNKCGNVLQSTDGLQGHMKKLHKQAAYQCQERDEDGATCQFRSYWADLMRDHYLEEHGCTVVPDEFKPFKKPDEKAICNRYVKSCVKNPKDYGERSWLKGDHYKIHYDKLGGKSYVCAYEGCGHVDINSMHMQDHVNAEHVKRLIQCNICGRGWYKYRYMKEHMRLYHKLSAYECKATEKCQFKTFIPEFMAEHYQKKHGLSDVPDEYKPFDPSKPVVMASHGQRSKDRAGRSKDKAGKRIWKSKEFKKTALTKALEPHAEITRDESGRPVKWSCKKCDSSFRKQKSFQIHFQGKHQNIKSKCPECSFETMWDTNLAIHMKKIHKKKVKKCPIPTCRFRTVLEDRMQLHLSSKHKAVYDENQHALVCFK